MESRPTKLARLQRLRCRLPYISQSALSSILRVARDEELPQECRRSDIRAARDLGTQVDTPYGKLHQRISLPSSDSADGIEVEVQHPLAMMYHCCTVSKPLSDLIMRVASTNGPTLMDPWHLILYSDEILPGNQLAYTHERKFWGMYWSILEFGAQILSEEEQWKYHRLN